MAMASALATVGATVVLTGRSGERASSAAAALTGAAGLELDVRNEAYVAHAVDQAWSRLGGIEAGGDGAADRLAGVRRA
jgi:NADP-dependent 3-hydroxy acid dehydrogenase YdfG